MTTGKGGTALGNAGTEAGKGDATTTTNGATGTQTSSTTNTESKGADVGTDAAAKAAADKAAADQAAAELAAKPFTDVAQLKLAEGFKLDDALMKDFLPLAKEHGFTAKQAQALIEFQATLAKKSDEARSSALDAAADNAVEALKKDAVIGGAKFDASMKLAGRALREFGGKVDEKTGKSELVEFINSARLEDGSMLGDNALFARFLVNAGSRLGEDPTGGGRGGAAPKPKPALSYPNSPELKHS
jgi:hypothetical protein